MTTLSTLDATRSAIKEALTLFGTRRFYNLRERDPQAMLLASIRQGLGDPVVPALLSLEKGARHVHVEPIETSRVHLELKVEGTKVSDLIIFRDDRRVRLRCYPAGPCDVVATVDGSDVEVVVEIKAAPSSTQWRTFVEDLEKLADLKQRHPHIHTIFALFDKSLSAAGAHGNPDYRWLPPSGGNGQIEVFCLDAKGSLRIERV